MKKKLFKKKGIRYLLTLMIYSLMFPVNIFALPQGGQVVGGQANIAVPNAALMQINQLTNKAIIDWNSFSIAHPELVQFMQPGASSIALNRVLGGDPSQIFGQLSANGGVWLINPAGILVGSTGVINVNSLLLSTLDINNEDFLSGNYVFNQRLNTTLASIVNQGTITAAQGGHVTLLAPGIVNQGTILASLGKVNLGAGEQATLNFVGSEMISFAIDKAVADKVRGLDGQELENSILNEGTIAAEGGEIVLSARTAYDAIKSVVNNKGVIEAETIGNINGIIVLDGGEQGIVYNSGTLDVSGLDEGETGGEIQVTGEKVGLIHYSEFKAMGRKGGGNVFVGGGFQGKNPAIRNAKRTYVGKDAKINADAIDEGDGGEVIVWADGDTYFYGDISARGGASSGDGGFVEVSGKNYLDFQGTVDLKADYGEVGSILLDPKNIAVATLSPGGYTTQLAANVLDDFTDNPSELSWITPTDLVTLLNAADVTFQANNDIDFEDTVAATLGSYSLTLQAGRSITINADISLYGAFTATANDNSAAVVEVNRDTGVATFTMDDNVTINTTLHATDGDIKIDMSTSDGGFDSGDITIANLNAGTADVLIDQGGATLGSDILRTTNSLITADTAALDISNAANTTGAIGGRYSQMLCTALGSDPVYFNTVNKLYSFNYHR